ncbi:MAG: hypothetical protein NLN66_06160, partial [Candidatus Thalassarchaeaceae archaeon]|nr:hypothetical protein [Candidatus Thalassarchaeaceae archaeon]
MGLLEKAGNIKTIEKEPVQTKSAMNKEAAAYDAKVAKSIPTPKAAKVAKPAKVKKVKKAKAAKAPKTARVRKERISKEFPEGFDQVNSARSWFRSLVDLFVNFSMFSFYLATNIVAGGSSDLTYVLIVSLLLPIGNLIFMPYKTGRTIGQWITTTRYVNSRGNNPPFLFHLLKSSPVVSYLAGAGAFILAISAATEWTTGMIGVVVTLVLIFLLVPGDWLFKKFHHQSFGIWEFLFGGVWNARAQKEETGSGNKFFQRLESLSEYTESKGWLEDKDEDA